MPMVPVPHLPLMGVNLHNHRRAIRDDEARLLKNLVPTEDGILNKRLGTEAVLTANSVIYGPVINYWRARNSQISVIEDAADLNIFKLCAMVAHQTGVVAYTATQSMGGSAFNWRPQIIPSLELLDKRALSLCFPGMRPTGADFAAWEISTPDFSAPTTFTGRNFFGTDNGTLNVKGAAVFRQRMVYWFRNEGFEDCLVWSDIHEPFVIGDAALRTNAGASGSRYVRLPSSRDNRIVAAFEVSQSGVTDISSTALLVLTRHSAYLISGEPEETTYTGTNYFGTYNCVTLNEAAGCASLETMVRTPYGVIWAGPDDVWIMVNGNLPFRIGTKIRSALQNTEANYQWKWYATYHNGFYRLSIFSENQTLSKSARLEHQWWLDLRSGPPRSAGEARWFGPMIHTQNGGTNVGTFMMCPENPAATGTLYAPVDPEALYSADLGSFPALGSDANFVSKCDKTDGYDRHALDGTSYADLRPGNEIITKYTSKEYNWGAAHQDKIHMGIEVDQSHAGIGYTAVATEVLTNQVTTHTDLQVFPNTEDQEFRPTAYEPGEGERLTGKTHQISIYDVPGLFIVKGQNDQAVFWSGVTGGEVTATIPPGVYATVEELLFALQAAWSTFSLGFSIFADQKGEAVTLSNASTGDLGTATWYPVVTAKSVSASFWLLLGFMTTPLAALSHTGDTVASLPVSSPLSIAGIVSRIYYFQRRPALASAADE